MGTGKRSEEEWRAKLTAEQYRITREKSTERAFSGEYHASKAAGVYKCVCCGADLFASSSKFDSRTGWPSFTEPANDENVKIAEDSSHGMRRTEVMCAECDAHLGHVFPDGPGPRGQRYCINSASLVLEPEPPAKG